MSVKRTLLPGVYVELPYDRGFTHILVRVTPEGDRVVARLNADAAMALANDYGVPFTDADEKPLAHVTLGADFPWKLSAKARNLLTAATCANSRSIHP